MSKQKKRIGRKAGGGKSISSLLTPITEAIAISKGVDEDDLATVQARRKQEDRQERRRDERRQDKRRLQLLRDTKDLDLEYKNKEAEENLNRLLGFIGDDASSQIPSAAQPAPSLFSPDPARSVDAAPPLAPVSEMMESSLPPAMQGLEATDYPAFDIKKPQGQQNYIDLESDNLRDIARQPLTTEGQKQVQLRRQALSDMGNLMPSQKREALEQYQKDVSKSDLRDEVIKVATIPEELQSGQDIAEVNGTIISRNPKGGYSINHKMVLENIRRATELDKAAINAMVEEDRIAQKSEVSNQERARQAIENRYGGMPEFGRAVDRGVEDLLRSFNVSRSQLTPDMLGKLNRQVEQQKMQEALDSPLSGFDSEEKESNLLTTSEILQLKREYGFDLTKPEGRAELRQIASVLGKSVPFSAESQASVDLSDSSVPLDPLDAFSKFTGNTVKLEAAKSYSGQLESSLSRLQEGLTLDAVYEKIEEGMPEIYDSISEDKRNDPKVINELKLAVDPFIVTQLEVLRNTKNIRRGKSLVSKADLDGKSGLEVYYKSYFANRKTESHIGYLPPLQRKALLKKGQFLTGDKIRDTAMVNGLPAGEGFVDIDGTLLYKRARQRTREEEARQAEANREAQERALKFSEASEGMSATRFGGTTRF